MFEAHFSVGGIRSGIGQPFWLPARVGPLDRPTGSGWTSKVVGGTLQIVDFDVFLYGALVCVHPWFRCPFVVICRSGFRLTDAVRPAYKYLAARSLKFRQGHVSGEPAQYNNERTNAHAHAHAHAHKFYTCVHAYARECPCTHELTYITIHVQTHSS